MGKLSVVSVALLLVQLAVAQQFRYPDVRRNESVIEDYYGTMVMDPYRHLEDIDSVEVQNFVEAQNNLTTEYLSRSSAYDEIEKKITEGYNYPRYSVPMRYGNRYFSSMNTGLQNQDVWYVQDSLDSELRVVFDINELSPNGTIALGQIHFSGDGELAALVLNGKGSDISTIQFLNTTSGQFFPEIIDDIKFASLTWSKNGLGIFYYRHPNPESGSDLNQKVYYHRVGSDQREDVLVVDIDDPVIIIITVRLSDDGNNLILLPNRGSDESLVFYAPLESQINSHGGIREKAQLIPVIPEWADSYSFVAMEEGTLYLTTNKDAPNYRIVGIPLNNTDPINWTTLVPEHEKNILARGLQIDTDKLLLITYVDVRTQLEIRSLGDGRLIQTIETPLGSSLSHLFGQKSDNEIFFQIVSFISPGVMYRVDLTRTPYPVEIIKESRVPGFTPEDFIMKQVFYESKDGTTVPMFITHRKNLTLDGGNNAILYGYGGFGINLTPFYVPDRPVFLQNFDGVYATPNIRGGGEYGRKWHEGGRLLNKQNGFDDFHAAAEYLIKENYTSAAKLAIQGGSNGGFLVGACANQRPEMYAAVINQVGVHDLLRFQNFTIGYAWCPEYGCSNWGNQTIFENLYRLSPLHNVRLPSNPQVQYPSIFITTADHDDRVVPLHSYKLAAELQYEIGRSSRQTNPILIKIHADAGHGQGKPISMQIAEYAEIYAFLAESAGFVFRP